MIRRIRDLLYEQGFTISGARNKLQESAHSDNDSASVQHLRAMQSAEVTLAATPSEVTSDQQLPLSWTEFQQELLDIQKILGV